MKIYYVAIYIPDEGTRSFIFDASTYDEAAAYALTLAVNFDGIIEEIGHFFTVGCTMELCTF